MDGSTDRRTSRGARARPAAWAGIAALPLVAGCGASEPSPSDALAREIAVEVCASAAACGSPFGAPEVGTGSVCVETHAFWVAQWTLGQLDAAVDAGRATYDPAAAAACPAAIRAAGCARDPSPFEPDVWDACEDVYVGLVPDGGACEHDEVCGAASYCQRSSDACGACAPRLPAGSMCHAGSCAAGLACVGGICIASTDALGTSCGGATGDSCGRLDLHCLAPTGGADMGVCVRWDDDALAIGEPCDPSADAWCAAGLACAFDFATGRASCVTPVGPGEACSWAYPEMCPSGFLCSVVGEALACAPLPGPGDPCAGNAHDRCAPGLQCDYATGICEALGRLGEPCTEPFDCASSTCASGLCAARPGCSG